MDEVEGPRGLGAVIRENAPELLGAGVGGGLQSLGVDPVSSAAAASSIALALRFDRDHGERRLTRAAYSLQLAADDVGGDEALERLATADDYRRELTARVLRAAARTPMPDKLPALAAVLVRGLTAEGHDSEALVLAGALDDLEEPHVLLLQTLATDHPDNPREDPADKRDSRSWSEYEMREALPGVASLLPALLAACVRHGLVEKRFDAYAGAPSGWRMTDVGHRCLELLRRDVD